MRRRSFLALGAAAALLLIVGLVVAGGDLQRRLAAAAAPLQARLRLALRQARAAG